MGNNYQKHKAYVTARQREWQQTPGVCHKCGEPAKFSPNYCPRCLWTIRQSSRKNSPHGSEHNGSYISDAKLVREVKAQKLRMLRGRLPEIKRLAEERAEVWRLYYHEGLTIGQIGKKLGIAWGHTRKKLKQADEILASLFSSNVKDQPRRA